MTIAGERRRPLSEREAATLRYLLSVSDPRVDALRGQADVASVVDKCECGCATVALEVDCGAATASALAEGRPAIEARTRPEEAEPPVELLLFLKEGWLSSLEIAWYDENLPSEFPPLDAFAPPQLCE
jgi:hypothetical protein